MSDARETAREVLAAVGAGAKLDTVLYETVRPGGLDLRDRNYAARLVKIVLRNRALLDYQVSFFAKRPADGIQPGLLDILRAGAAELCFMRTADYAAVNEAVDAARTGFGKKAAGFTNAVLRRIAEAPEPILPDERDETGYLSVKYSHPEWLVKRWLKRLGRAECERLLAVNNTDAPLYVVHDPLRNAGFELAAAIREAGADAEAGPLETTRVELRGKSIAEVPPLNDGRALIVDPSSTLGVLALSPPRGAFALDMCAGVGGKTRQLSWAVGPSGRVLATDNVVAKVDTLASNVEKNAMENVRPVVADLTRPLVRGLSHILADVPCSNTGVLRRKPDIRWRLKEEDLTGHAALQIRLLSEGGRSLAPGGKLVYQTCSTEPEENERVVEAVLAAFPELELETPAGDLLDVYIDGNYLRAWPHRHGTNGAFVAIIRKKNGREREG
jgi:16S rRNA (cytosine967-C5)-methyltransferase